MRNILLLDREFGAGGSTLGARVAARLGWKLFDDELTREIARLANVHVDTCRRMEERIDPPLKRLVNIIWRGSFERNLSDPDLAILDTDRLVALTGRVVAEAADRAPCVIVGRGAPYFLRKRSDTLAVFLYGSRELKFRRVLARVGDSRRAAEMVDTIDEDRRKFNREHFHLPWPERRLFHAMFDTDRGDDAVVEAILQLLSGGGAKGPSACL